MKFILYFQLFICLLLAGCANRRGNLPQRQTSVFQVNLDSLNLLDQSRGRLIPVALYFPHTTRHPSPVVIFSHGYGANKGGDHKAYSYLTEYLASQGYFVASIQHELPTDELLPTVGNPREVRRPNWERGVKTFFSCFTN